MFIGDFFLFVSFISGVLVFSCMPLSFPDQSVFFRGVVLFRPPVLANKFEDSSVHFDEEKFTNAKLKKFIQDNM